MKLFTPIESNNRCRVVLGTQIGRLTESIGDYAADKSLALKLKEEENPRALWVIINVIVHRFLALPWRLTLWGLNWALQHFRLH